MPGIAGIIGRGSTKEYTSQLSEMVKSMLHEPFYASRYFSNDQLGIWGGWAGHVGSFSDCVPIWNETKDICLIFSGEDVTDSSEIEDLRARGHAYSSDDASYLVHLYEEKEIKFFEELNGWFSGLLVDLRERKAILFNDRYGLGRIYYYENAQGFYFASEAKALLRVLPELRQLDLQSLAETFSCGCPLQNRTLFSKVSVLPGGSAWVFSHGRQVRKETYFRPEYWENQPPLGEVEFYERMKEVFQQILPQYYRGQRRVGISLTGGVDSRMIMAWTRRSSDEVVPCYTFGGMSRDSNDVKIARQAAKICGQPHEVIPVGHEFLSQFPSLAEKTVYLTDGAMDVSGSADLFANRKAREIAPVRLTGNYGGEILRSIVAFKPVQLWEGLFAPPFKDLVRGAAETYSNELTGRRLSFVAFKQVPWHHYSRLSLELSQLTVRSPYLDNDLVALAFQMPACLAANNQVSLRLIADGNSELGHMETDRSLMYGPHTMLDRLSHIYQEFTFRAEYAFDYGMPHWLAKIDNILRPFHCERLFLGRHKFYHFRLWYRNELSQYIRDVLLDPRTRSRSYLDARTLEKVVRGHTEGWRNHTSEIHRLLTVELIQRQLIEA